MRTIVAIAAILIILPLLLFGAAPSGDPSIKDEVFVAKLLSPLSASKNKKGDKFTLQVLEPKSYAGAIIEAEVSKVKASGKVSGKSEFLFSFDSLTTKKGATIPIAADLKEVINSKGVAQTDDEGHIIGKSSAQKKLFGILGLGTAGAAIGRVVGGGTGAAKGAAIGAAIGMTITFSTKGPDIKFEPGSKFRLQVNSQESSSANPK
jgi:hypothetical protein